MFELLIAASLPLNAPLRAGYCLMGHKHPLQLAPIIINLSIAFFCLFWSSQQKHPSKLQIQACNARTEEIQQAQTFM